MPQRHTSEQSEINTEIASDQNGAQRSICLGRFHILSGAVCCSGKAPVEPPVCRHRNLLQSPGPPPAAVSILKMCARGRSPLSVAKMIALLSGSDLFMLRIKLIGLHIVVRVRRFRMEG